MKIYKIKDSDGYYCTESFKSREEAEEFYKKEFSKYNGMLAGQPHKIVEEDLNE